MKKQHSYLTIFLLLTLFSCHRKAHHSKIALSDLKIQQCDYTYFKAKSKINYTDAESNLTATLNVRIKKDSAIWLSVSVLAEVMRTVITKDSVFFVQKLPHKTYKEFSIKELSKQTGVNMDYQLLEAIFLGNLIVYDQKNIQIKQTESTIKTLEKFTQFDINNIISKTNHKVSEVIVNEKANGSRATINFSDHETTDKCDVPMKIAFDALINFSADSTISNHVDLEYSKVKFLEDALNMPFKKEND